VVSGCQFHPVGDYLRFVRVPENVPVGGEILRVQVQPKGLLSIQPMDKVKIMVFIENRETIISYIESGSLCNRKLFKLRRKIAFSFVRPLTFR
jgi:hypothetical protein